MYKGNISLMGTRKEEKKDKEKERKNNRRYTENKTPKNFLDNLFNFMVIVPTRKPSQNFPEKMLTRGFHFELKWCFYSAQSLLLQFTVILELISAVKIQCLGSWAGWLQHTVQRKRWNEKMLFVLLFSFYIMKALWYQEGKGRFYNWETAVWGRTTSAMESNSTCWHPYAQGCQQLEMEQYQGKRRGFKM